MSIAGLVLVVLMAPLVSLTIFPVACIGKEDNQRCTPSSCGDLHNISTPFRLKGDPLECGDERFELACNENNRTTLSFCYGIFYVQDISYTNQTIQLVDASLHTDSCSIPLYSLTSEDINNCLGNPFNMGDYYWDSSSFIVFMNCTKPVLQNYFKYVNATPCINNNFSTPNNTYFYAFLEHLVASDVPQLCTIQSIVLAPFVNNMASPSIFYIHHHLLKGFQLGWDDPNYYSEKITITKRLGSWLEDNFVYPVGQFLGNLLYYLFLPDGYYKFFGDDYHNGPARIASIILKGRTLLGVLCFTAFLIYKFRRRHLSIDDAIEEFLQSDNKLVPIRYSYLEIKEMTKGFKEKLGRGGYGSVYKGKSRSGQLVAVKVLSISKANGQDFINEVATIGRIYHVNIVRLIGFCVEGSKRVLIYDFMANGSLDKFIFHAGEKIAPLSWERLYKIGLGVAQGIEYLHQGCNMQILHFDIKPHNILLDENFIPKVSDFGLAKLYPIDDSIVSLTAARGTIGYIAPELFYKNIGGISYKADVYSFGMLLMEMVGKRKNATEHSSQIYFPSWVYDQINQGEECIELEDANEDEKTFVRKLIIIALWCIQLKPTDRPSMSKVLEMLEGEIELLQMPPKPFLYPQEMSIVDHADNNPSGAPISSYNSIGTITLDGR